MGDLMAKKWDTPTDGISRKMFDRAMDTHIRRYAILSDEVAEIRRDLAAWRAFQKLLEESKESEEE